MPQNEHIELFQKRYGKRLDHEEKARKKEAREPHKRSAMAKKLIGLKAKLYSKERFKEKITMKKTINQHGEKGKVRAEYEDEMRKINSLDHEGQKIRYKVILALFCARKELFNPQIVHDLPLELMPNLLELVQLELGRNGYGSGVVEMKEKIMSMDHTLRRLYKAIHGSNISSLFARRNSRKRKFLEDEHQG